MVGSAVDLSAGYTAEQLFATTQTIYAFDDATGLPIDLFVRPGNLSTLTKLEISAISQAT